MGDSKEIAALGLAGMLALSLCFLFGIWAYTCSPDDNPAPLFWVSGAMAGIVGAVLLAILMKVDL